MLFSDVCYPWAITLERKQTPTLIVYTEDTTGNRPGAGKSGGAFSPAVRSTDIG